MAAVRRAREVLAKEAGDSGRSGYDPTLLMIFCFYCFFSFLRYSMLLNTLAILGILTGLSESIMGIPIDQPEQWYDRAGFEHFSRLRRSRSRKRPPYLQC